MKAERTLAVLAVLTALGIAGFWIAFFTIGLTPAHLPACYLAYEHSFPVPDAALSVTLAVAGVLVLRGRELGRNLGLAAAGGLVFLGILDASFNLQQGVYAASTADLFVNALINAWCVVFGLLLGRCFAVRSRPLQ
jgi:hypothetical protein